MALVNSVYRISVRNDQYQTLQIVDEPGFSARYAEPFSGRVMDWQRGLDKPIECVVGHPERPKSSFSYLLPGMVVVDADALNALDEQARDCFQPIGLRIGETIRWAINVTDVRNALDKALSVYHRDEEGQIVGVSEYVFKANRLPGPIFKLPETASKEFFTHTGAARFNFISEYNRLDLTGLDFEQVWTQALD